MKMCWSVSRAVSGNVSVSPASTVCVIDQASPNESAGANSLHFFRSYRSIIFPPPSPRPRLTI